MQVLDGHRVVGVAGGEPEVTPVRLDELRVAGGLALGDERVRGGDGGGGGEEPRGGDGEAGEVAHGAFVVLECCREMDGLTFGWAGHEVLLIFLVYFYFCVLFLFGDAADTTFT